MRLYFFRATPEISLEDMRKVARRVGHIFGVDYSIFTGPVAGSPDQATCVEDLLSISDQFLERGEPVVAIVFINAEVQEDEPILGQSSEPNRGAWVRWSSDLNRVVYTTVHELGHICEADHCERESCVMYPVYRERGGSSMEELFCGKCLAVVKESWVYTRLKQASEDRARKGARLPEILSTPGMRIARGARAEPQTPRTKSGVSAPAAPGKPPSSSFPPWPSKESPEEFVRKVKEYFGVQD